MEITKAMRYWAAMNASEHQLEETGQLPKRYRRDGLRIASSRLCVTSEFLAWASGPDGQSIVRNMTSPELSAFLAEMKKVYS